LTPPHVEAILGPAGKGKEKKSDIYIKERIRLKLAELLTESGAVAAAMLGFEKRPEQEEMLNAVEAAVAGRRHLIVEAGTGVGKTFAYLIPAIRWAAESGGHAVVSTNTINLQEQLFHKDLPFLETVLPWKFTYALAKGRSNYVCLRRLRFAFERQRELFADASLIMDLRNIADWADRSHDGSRQEIGFKYVDEVWANVCCEGDNCLGRSCDSFQKCFYQAARQRCREATLVIVNHHLYFADLALRKDGFSLLPKHEMAVFDEAHMIEAVAQEHLGLEITNHQVGYLLNMLYKGTGGKTRGFLTAFREARCRDQVEEVRLASDRFFEAVIAWYDRRVTPNGRVRQANIVENPLTPALMALSTELTRLKRGRTLTKDVETELMSYAMKALALARAAEAFVGQSVENGVYWIELSRRRQPHVTLKCVPLDVSMELRESVFKSLATAVLTSATLAVEKERPFDYLKQRIGLDEAAELKVGSPFDYRRQVKMFLFRHLPDPNDFAKFEAAVSEKVVEYVKMSNGRAFVLFTNYELMKAVYERTHDRIKAMGYDVQRQGEGVSRHMMLEAFKKRLGSVIFGADSFWQGVDVPGEALENVIITKLPFPVPTSPLVEAKCELLEREGGDAFWGFSVPEAVIRLRQGFGRLIRRKDDKGIVVILDNRILTKAYGRKFLDALPECSVMIDGCDVDGA
jgi:ATP-dependent DNA helicase DinG